ncbi:MAG: GGDEF domain-containing protein [Lachnospiraceae bacterium]|nr:GGDEF domain-containing protein [Lachnospiraceae bacterium]
MEHLTEIKQLQADIIKTRRSNHKEAYRLCEKLLALSEQEGNDYGIAFAQYYMCDVMSNDLDFDELVRKLSKLALPFHEAGFYDFEIKTYNLLGIAYDNKFNTFMALENYQKALDVAADYNFPMLEALTNCNVGCIFARLDDNKTALTYFESSYNQLLSLELTPQVENYRQLLVSNLALTNALLGNYEDARAYCKQADEFEKIDDIYSASINIARAMVLLDKGDLDGSRNFARAGADYYLSTHSIYDTFDTFINIYRLLYKLEEFELLDKYFYSTIEYAKAKKLTSLRRDIFELYIDYLSKRNEEKKLLKACKEYYRLNSRLDAKESRTTAKSMKLKLSLMKASSAREELIESNKALTMISQTDTLTHLPNRYRYDSLLNSLFAKAVKEKKEFCYVIMDVDCFKQYNDTYGHLKGDSCLWHIANVLRSEMSNDITFFRYGGDEFAGIYYDKSPEYVKASIKRLEDGIKGLGLEHRTSAKTDCVSVTMGYVVKVPSPSEKALDLVSEADLLLYRNKAKWKEAGK